MNESRWLSRLAIASLLAWGAAPLACGSSDSQGDTIGDDGGAGDDASGGGGGDGASSGDSGSGGGGDGGVCAPLQAACGAAGDCCSHLCLNAKCASSISVCGNAGQGCAVNTDCCDGACVNGACGANQCLSIGAACPVAGNVCCTQHCESGKCAPIVGGTSDGGTTTACTTANNACAQNGDCCSGLCKNNVCDIASSYCIQNGDICFNGADCCGGVCNSPSSSPVSPANPGTCGLPASAGGTNCTGVDGTLCDPAQIGCASGCCSDLCAPWGPTGIAICQQAQGCHVEGDLCRKDGDCCGGEPADAGIVGGGLVKCSTSVNGGTIGYCMTPTGGNGGGNACVPAGDVCHYTSDPGYTCPSSSSRADCCDGQTPNKALCQLDKLGVPRCLAYQGGADAGTNACRQTGQTCATADDCCNGDPCVPNSSGQLVCAATACIPTTGACTSNADCCTGNQCVIPVGSLQGTCSASLPPPPTSDGGTAGGTGDGGSGGAGACADFGQQCTSAACCTGTFCSNGYCSIVK